MHDTTTWLAIAAAVLGSFALRYLPMQLSTARLPSWARAAMPFVPAAAFAALVTPSLVQGPWRPERLFAAAVAAYVAWRTGGVFETVLIGMGSLWAASWVMGAL